MLDTDKVKKLREAAGLTFEQAAEKAGFTSGQQWYLIESDRRANVKLDTLGKIASALGVDAADLLRPAKRSRGNK
jgi:transcriptional regulator with XRE-family HTH domain